MCGYFVGENFIETEFLIFGRESRPNTIKCFKIYRPSKAST